MISAMEPAANWPVLRHRQWRHLLRDLEQGLHGSVIRAGGDRLLDSTRLTINHAMLAPVVSLAYLIAKTYPDIESRRDMRILVLPDEDAGRADGGRWYRFLEPLLGGSVRCDITVAQLPSYDPNTLPVGYSSQLKRALSNLEPCTTMTTGLAEHNASMPRYDAVYIPYLPIAPEHRGLLHKDWLPANLAAGATLMGVNRSSWVEQATTLALFDAYHLGHGEAVDCAFDLGELMGKPEDEAFGRYGWVVHPTGQASAQVETPDHAAITRAVKFWRETNPSTGRRNPFAGQCVPAGADGRMVSIGLRGRGIDLETGRVFRVEQTHSNGIEATPTGAVLEPFVLTRPPASLSRMDRAIWVEHALARSGIS